MERRRRPKIPTCDKYIQIGCTIKATRVDKNDRKHGIIKDEEYVIIQPPKGKLNTHAGVYVEDCTGKPYFLQFHKYQTTNK